MFQTDPSSGNRKICHFADSFRSMILLGSFSNFYGLKLLTLFTLTSRSPKTLKNFLIFQSHKANFVKFSVSSQKRQITRS